MSYSNKSVVWEAHDPQNEFGDMTFLEPIDIKARKQPHQRIIKTSEGKELLSKSIFYVEPNEVNASIITKMDKLDGELIQESYVMMNLANKPRMYRFITV